MNLFTFLKGDCKAFAVNPQSGNTQSINKDTVLQYVFHSASEMADNECIVVNPTAADSNVIVIVFAASEDEGLVRFAARALAQVRETKRFEEIAALEARLAELRAPKASLEARMDELFEELRTEC
jgi:hypothetical protein